MNNLDDSENAKISDSAYSNSCSNSQSRRSHSSKSTHSGSHSSGSSGYGGKPSTSTSSNDTAQPPEKRYKDDKCRKKKSQTQIEPSIAEGIVDGEVIKDETIPTGAPHDEKTFTDKTTTSTTTMVLPVDLPVLPKDVMDISPPQSEKHEGSRSTEIVTSQPTPSCPTEGFSCVVSLHDGVVMYTTATLTPSLGYPRDMWIGRSFIDFVHPRDCDNFASQITNGLALPKNINGTHNKGQAPASVSSMFCRIRRYRGLSGGFGVRERIITYMPFLIKLSFKNINEDNGGVTYLVIQATPLHSAFKTSNEKVSRDVPFVIRHIANGKLDYIDLESVPYLGYLPQDVTDTDVLQLYHPDDLPYLRQVYETIMKEGSMTRSKPFRMLAQNGDYITLETEWSSFVNPWTKRLEFIIGKHYVLEGPNNPDVFQSLDPEKVVNMCAEEKKNIRTLQDSILQMLNESVSKPPELAKQQMTQRCHDLASFMESLMEEQPKNEEELRLDIQDPDHSYYERDSVLLGGISPHHDYNDSKSSTETPLSYNQLNYNDNLQRYFDSHQPFSNEDYNTVTAENILGINPSNPCIHSSPPAQNSGESGEQTSSCESSCPGKAVTPNAQSMSNQPFRLTEMLLMKHNSDMEKDLLKRHRGIRSTTKIERQILSSENRQKKKVHLARCNASFQPTSAPTPGPSSPVMSQPHGIKRTAKNSDTGTRKLHRSSRRNIRVKQGIAASTHQSTAVTTTVVDTMGAHTQSSRNIYDRQCTRVATTHHSSINTTVAPNPWTNAPGTSVRTFIPWIPSMSQQMSIMSPVAAVPLPYMMYGQPVFESPFMYSPISPQVSFSNQHNLMHTINYSAQSTLDLTNRNYEQSIKIPVMTSSVSSGSKSNNRKDRREENVDRTDGESSYSSFYSSFFKTECGSGEDSGDPKNQVNNQLKPNNLAYSSQEQKNVTKRKMDPPWLDQVCLTSELIYNYQIITKGMEEVLSADRAKINNLDQPSLVNEQLGQLYLDLQLEGVAARLTLEEGITSSGSSGEETSKPVMGPKRKRHYSKLVMIYEEDAPLPPPSDEDGSASPKPMTEINTSQAS